MTYSSAEQAFRAKAPDIMNKLMGDFAITPADAAAIIGNAGHESYGLTVLQEIKPTVPGSRGGWGWMQWTGPRRKAFEAYCARTGKDKASDEANYAYLFLELKGIEGHEKAAISKLKAAKGLEAKVIAFEKAFLRAGVKHYSSRQRWASIALEAWQKKAGPAPVLPSLQKPAARTPANTPKRGPFAVLIAAIAAALYAILKSRGLVP